MTMSDKQKRDEPVRPSHGLEDLMRIGDPINRISAAVEFTTYAADRASRGRAIRDGAIRAAFAAGVSKPEIARRTGINLSTIKAATR